MVHIDVILLLGDAQVVLGILFSCVVHRPFYLTCIISSSSFLYFLASLDKKIMHVCEEIMGNGLWEFF
jgi:hypothetical protein